MSVVPPAVNPERLMPAAIPVSSNSTVLQDWCEIHGDHNGFISSFTNFTLSRRRALRNRFTGPSQWRRLLCLGIILVDFAIIGIAASMFDISLIVYETGTACVMGGAALSIIIFRIARPAMPIDWLIVGAIFIGLGILLVVDPSMASHMVFATFCSLLVLLSLALIWIGTTTSPATGRVWVSAGGFTALLCAIVGIGAHIADSSPRPDTVASVVLLLTGMSFFGLALSLRPKG